MTTPIGVVIFAWESLFPPKSNRFCFLLPTALAYGEERCYNPNISNYHFKEKECE